MSPSRIWCLIVSSGRHGTKMLTSTHKSWTQSTEDELTRGQRRHERSSSEKLYLPVNLLSDTNSDIFSKY